MDKLMFIFASVVAISAILGIMDRVKHCWETTYWSTIKHPAWLVRYLNPHERLIEKAPAIVAFLLKGPFAGINDFWHTLKTVFIHLVWFSFWYFHHEGSLIAFLIMADLAYMVIFELFFTAIFNNKNFKP